MAFLHTLFGWKWYVIPICSYSLEHVSDADVKGHYQGQHLMLDFMSVYSSSEWLLWQGPRCNNYCILCKTLHLCYILNKGWVSNTVWATLITCKIHIGYNDWRYHKRDTFWQWLCKIRFDVGLWCGSMIFSDHNPTECDSVSRMV